MSGATQCSRSWQAEAAEDRRLSDADRASFERHLESCADCTRTVRDLAQLKGLVTRTEAPPSSPLEHRRARNELLRRANEVTLDAPRSRFRPALALAAALGALALAVSVVLRLRAPVAPAAPAPSEPTYELSASEGADWSFVERGPALKLAARRGRFDLSVHHLGDGQRFVLVLPDGELEVKGTRFVVDVDGVQTRSVHVREGRVALKVREHGTTVLLAAGESFAAPTSRPVPATSPTPSAEAPPPAPGTPSRSASSVAPTPPPGAAAPRSSAAPSASAPAGSGTEFARAMSAFSSGNYGEAEMLFQGFVAHHPADPRAEDATFLSAVSSARRGDRDGARALAKRYLALYPNGLRRREVEQLAE